MSNSKGAFEKNRAYNDDQNAEIAERNRLAKKYKQMRKAGEHGQTHTGQITRHSNPNGENLIEIIDDNMFI